MLSCSCGGALMRCIGGKVIDNKCECGNAQSTCGASASCAKLNPPALDCVWRDWGQWSDCSVSCGNNGTLSRVREIAVLAEHGGENCIGKSAVKRHCNGTGTAQECTPPKIRLKPVVKPDRSG